MAHSSYFQFDDDNKMKSEDILSFVREMDKL